MSSLGQLSGRIDRTLKRVKELTKALIAIRAELLQKTDALKLTPDAIDQAKKTVADFLEPLASVIATESGGNDEQKLILDRLKKGGRPTADYGADFASMATALRASTGLTTEQVNKVSEVVGYLQGEVAEEVRRLRSR
jgi:hypothetical protein